MLDFLRHLCRSEGNLQPVIAVAGASGFANPAARGWRSPFRLASSRHRERPPILAQGNKQTRNARGNFARPRFRFGVWFAYNLDGPVVDQMPHPAIAIPWRSSIIAERQ
jgi:hypothetical protein